jgi:hypothetical protein
MERPTIQFSEILRDELGIGVKQCVQYNPSRVSEPESLSFQLNRDPLRNPNRVQAILHDCQTWLNNHSRADY